MNTAHDLRLAMAANSEAADFTAKVPTTTNPSTNTGFHDLSSSLLGFVAKGESPEWLQVIPFGTNSNNDVFDMRVWGWSKIFAVDKWVPQLLAQFAVTVGNIAQGETNTFMADTIVKTYGGDDVDIISPVADVTGSAIIHLRGCQLIEFDFDLGSGAAAMNAWWRPIRRK